MDVDDDILDILTMVTMLKEARECLNEMAGRRYWVRPEYQDRDSKGFFALHFNRIYKRNSAHFKQLTGMSQEMFDLLFGFLEEALTKNSNRPSITPKCRLFLTLTYLSQGGSHQMLSEKFKMGLTTVKRIISDTCDIIWKALRSLYVCPPIDNEWLPMSDEFRNAWNLPHCVAAVDAKLINLSVTPNDVAIKKKFKSKQSLVLLAACDANYVFTNIDIGVYNRESDATVWNMEFYKEMISGKLRLPKSDVLSDTEIHLPYYMIGHSSFPLKTYLMRPYAGNQLTPDCITFNQHLAKVQNVAENAFGILIAHWQILQTPMHMSAKTAEQIVKATVLLHNFLKTHDETYSPCGFVDAYEGEDIIEGVWRQQVDKPLQSIGRIGSNNATQKAYDIRDYLKYYLNAVQEKNVYQVAWVHGMGVVLKIKEIILLDLDRKLLESIADKIVQNLNLEDTWYLLLVSTPPPLKIQNSYHRKIILSLESEGNN